MSTPRLPPPDKRSSADWVRNLSPADRTAFLRTIAPDSQAHLRLLYNWSFWGRPQQFAPPGDWSLWLILSGRGWGKSRVGAEWVREQVELGKCKRLALVARTAADARDVMVQGDSGILRISPPWFRPRYEPSKRRLTWPNGAIATLFSAEKPDALRGPQYDGAWCDELAAWKYDQDAWDQLQFGLRLGHDPRVIVTTTPRPTPLVKELLAEAKASSSFTVGSTYDNAGNLAPRFLTKLLGRYQGTRLGRQEIEGAILDDAPGALWKRAWLEANRKRAWIEEAGTGDRLPAFRRIVLAVDPAVSTDGASAETGIVVVGLAEDGLGYVLDDISGQHSPARWGALVIEAFDTWKADKIIGEANNGGNLVEANVLAAARVLGRPAPPYKAVHASRGKQTRAEPIAALYEQGRICHHGAFPYLEDQLCTWNPAEDERSPDRLDALVWGLTELMLGATSDDALLVRARSSRR
jgi:phage terminase large subunit-like protein